MREMTINDFNAALASSAPVPGGGGVSALVSALGMGLGIMVAALTTGKKKYAENEAELCKISEEAKRIQEQLLELIDGDAECFEPLSRAYALPKDAPERDEVMESCLALAASAPMEVAEMSCRAIELMDRLALLGGALSVSDAGCGAELCKAALRSAALNVYVNTRLMKNRDTAEAMNGKIDAMLKKFVPEANKIYDSVVIRLAR